MEYIVVNTNATVAGQSLGTLIRTQMQARGLNHATTGLGYQVH